jgi:hypothetical protein
MILKKAFNVARAILMSLTSGLYLAGRLPELIEGKKLDMLIMESSMFSAVLYTDPKKRCPNKVTEETYELVTVLSTMIKMGYSIGKICKSLMGFDVRVDLNGTPSYVDVHVDVPKDKDNEHDKTGDLDGKEGKETKDSKDGK